LLKLFSLKKVFHRELLSDSININILKEILKEIVDRFDFFNSK